eukprot:GFUD01002747.1.p1 GENE.GFUD01002747.1~~GFUD01002747.1.p1  ORF type:complete len:180 (-),score=50.42 GFUD01002747.1:130-669(-)
MPSKSTQLTGGGGASNPEVGQSKYSKSVSNTQKSPSTLCGYQTTAWTDWRAKPQLDDSLDLDSPNKIELKSKKSRKPLQALNLKPSLLSDNSSLSPDILSKVSSAGLANTADDTFDKMLDNVKEKRAAGLTNTVDDSFDNVKEKRADPFEKLLENVDSQATDPFDHLLLSDISPHPPTA